MFEQDNQIDRRGFIGLAAGTVAYLVGGKLVYGATLPLEVRSSVAGRLGEQMPELDGVFVFDEASCRAMATDFGNYVHLLPVGVLRPRSGADIQKIIRYAKRQGIKVAVRGLGGCAYGQAQIDGGIVIDSADFKDLSWKGEVIEAAPGATLFDLVAFAGAQGRMVPVTPDTLFLTVGGTLSVGGLGEMSYRMGGIVDHVLELEVVTGEGELVSCSASKNTDLFEAVLGGMGQCAVIVRAHLTTLPRIEKVVSREFKYDTRAGLLRDLKLVANSETNGTVWGRLAKNKDEAWELFLTASSWGNAGIERALPAWAQQLSGQSTSTPTVSSYDQYANRRTQSYLEGVKNGGLLVPHPYMSFFLPESQTAEMIDFLISSPDATLGAASIPIFPLLRKNFARPTFSLPQQDLVFHIRIFRKPEKEGSADHLRMLELNEKVFIPRILKAGGTVYLPHSPILSHKQVTENFAPAVLTALARAKMKYDPHSTLKSDSIAIV